MAKGTAGYLADITIGGVDLALTSVTHSMSFDEEDVTELTDPAEAGLVTLLRNTLSGSGIYRPGNSGDLDPGQEDLEDGFLARTEFTVVFYPQGKTGSGNSVYTFKAHCTALSIDPGGPGGAVKFDFTLKNSDGVAPVKTKVA